MHLVQFLIPSRKQRNKIIYPASCELIEMVYFWNADVQKVAEPLSHSAARRLARSDLGYKYKRWAQSKCLPSQLLQLSWFAVQPWKQQPGRLSDVIAVHQQTLAMLGVDDGHPHPLHQRRQQEERPVEREKKK